MPTLYEYRCEQCRRDGVVYEDEQEEGVITEFRNMSDRDNVLECPRCHEPMVRAVAPNRVTIWWGSPHSPKKTCLGPTVDYYPPSRDAKRRKENPPKSFGWSPKEQSERTRELKEDAKRAPSVSEAPTPGVSVSNTKG